MKNVILATLGMGLLAMGLNTASAAGASSVGMGATVVGNCSMPSSPTGVNNLTGGVTEAGGVLNYFGLVQADGTAQAGGADLNYAGTLCTAAGGTINLRTTQGSVKGSNPMAAGSPLQDHIPYTAAAHLTGCTVATLNATGNAAAGSSVNSTCAAAVAGSLKVEVRTAATPKPLAAGVYADTLVVTVTP